MLKELINKIRNGKLTKTVPQAINDEDDDNKIVFKKDDEVIRMTIVGHPTLHTFFEKVREFPEEAQKTMLKLPLSILANSDQEANPGNYIWTTIDNKKYIIMTNGKTININQLKKVDDKYEERDISIHRETNSFTVNKAFHDSNLSTLEHKSFNCLRYNETPSDFELSPEEAQKEIELLFDDLIHEEKLLKELEGVFDVEFITSSISKYIAYIVSNHKNKGK